jgi:hypothetical protein
MLGVMWDRYYLIYSLEGVSRWPVGIVEADSRRHAVQKARRNWWDYSVVAAFLWADGCQPVAEIYSEAPLNDWWAVIDAHRTRRLAPNQSPKSTPPTPTKYQIAIARRSPKARWQQKGGKREDPPRRAGYIRVRYYPD